MGNFWCILAVMQTTGEAAMISKYCTSEPDKCPCHKHSNLQTFRSDGPTDAWGRQRDNTGKRYEIDDPRTFGSDHEKAEIRIFGISLKNDSKY